MNWGVFTYSQDQEVERELTWICHEVGQVVTERAGKQLRTLALMGGYGRGEGGVEQTSAGARPHNNLDFMVITTGCSSRETQRITSEVDRSLAPLRSQHDLGIDVSGITDAKLQRSACSVMWYDMRHGHKVIAGDDGFLPSLDKFRLQKISPESIRDLLVNRGALLIINRWNRRWPCGQLDLDPENEPLGARLWVRHLMKAIIGYGDALLYFAGQYHWSYLRKLERMRNCAIADPEFAQLYEQAGRFRLEPVYPERSIQECHAWQESLMPLLDPTHRQCESLRLGNRILDWEEYPMSAAAGVWRDGWRSPRQWAKKLLHSLRSTHLPGRSYEHWAARAAGPRGRLALAFPAIAYRVDSLRDFASWLLVGRTETTADWDALEDEYVDQWGAVGDTNFRHLKSRIETSTEALA